MTEAPLKPPELTCDVCSAEPAVGVACVPFVPMSVAYGRRCLDANAHPWDVLVANQACLGTTSLDADAVHPAWRSMVLDTLKHLGKTKEQFDADVVESIDFANQEEAKMAAQEPSGEPPRPFDQEKEEQ